MVSTLGNVNQLTNDYAEIARRPLEASQCALVVIDIQKKLLPPIFQKEQLVKNSQLLIRLAGILKIPVLMSTQYAGSRRDGSGDRFPAARNRGH